MKQEYFKTSLGIILKDNDNIRIKSSFKKTIISEEDFINSNPIKIKKGKYLEELNIFFKNTKYEWVWNYEEYKKLDNFECTKFKSITNYNIDKDIPQHTTDCLYTPNYFIVMYKGQLYYTFRSGNYYPQMQLVDFHTKKLTGKWTSIKNLAPVFNKTTKKII